MQFVEPCQVVSIFDVAKRNLFQWQSFGILQAEGFTQLVTPE
jgi:hypothetical protein